MKILYAGTLSTGHSAGYRILALERLGHTVVPFEVMDYWYQNSLLHKLDFRLAVGPKVEQLNSDLLALVARERPDVFWADKVLKLLPSTLEKVRAMGIVSVSYMIDNAFGPRKDPGWRLYRKCIPYFDLHVTQRDVSVADYRSRGARDVLKVQTAFEPTIHYPPPPGWNDQDRTRAVSFIGTPYDKRSEMLSSLSEAGVDVTISGAQHLWARELSKAMLERMWQSGVLYEKEYREGIWKSKINLSFLTRANLDEYTHKSFEIAGCGSFLLAERCPGHSAKFVEDEEAVFFEGTDELIAKVKRWVPDEAGRERIAAAGRARAVRDGYDNDTQVRRILDRVEGLRTVADVRS